MRMAAADERELARSGAGGTPLAQELALGVEDDDAVVAVAVGDVDIAVERIDRDVGGLVQHRGAAVQAGGLAARPVARRAAADLQQERPVPRPLLDHAAAAAGDPQVALVVDEAAVDADRQYVRIAPGLHDVAFLVVLDDRRSCDLADA